MGLAPRPLRRAAPGPRLWAERGCPALHEACSWCIGIQLPGQQAEAPQRRKPPSSPDTSCRICLPNTPLSLCFRLGFPTSPDLVGLSLWGTRVGVVLRGIRGNTLTSGHHTPGAAPAPHMFPRGAKSPLCDGLRQGPRIPPIALLSRETAVSSCGSARRGDVPASSQ